MTKIFCRCCAQPLSITGAHEFRKLLRCKNGTELEGRPGKEGTAGFPRIRAKNFDLILLWNEDSSKFEPLPE